MISPKISITNATLNFDEKPIFRNIHLSLPIGKWIALIGPSGVGKSSLLRMIAGLMTSKDNTHASFSTDSASLLHDQIAYMGQTDLLLPWLTALGNSTLGIRLRAKSRQEYLRAIKKAEALLEQVDLASAMDLFPHQLSGGMRQRVALVRTLMENKPIVLMDEPFSSLDTITRFKLQELATQLLKDKTVLFITHDPTEALRLAHAIYIMKGKPAKLELITSLQSQTPRNIDDPELLQKQRLLFNELLSEQGESCK